mmetsp:Transcript_66630/g.74646  ORF Transcript_66630/g.74646 Transcript_66630/m.74646 type:complete len:262 (+) Transcript_66630:62-847(+)
MGRKNKQKRIKKKNVTAAKSDGNNSATGRSGVGVGVGVAVGATATETRTMASLSTTASKCYHGSTAENFANGSDFSKATNEWMSLWKDFLGNHQQSCIVMSRFSTKYKRLVQDPVFIQHVFAVSTDMYLYDSKYGSFIQHPSIISLVRHMMRMGFIIKYDGSREGAQKGNKYTRDCLTDRGLIKCLYRETNTYCNCMKPYKEEAQTMDKIALCYGCMNEFQKEQLRRCSRCLEAPYCSNECMKKDWYKHKMCCIPHNKSEE